MDKITHLDRPTVRTISSRALALLKELEELGLSVESKGARFSDSNITLKFQVSVLNEDGVAETREWEDLKHYAKVWHGISDVSVFSEPFQSGREQYRVIGYRSRARKNPFICERVRDGSRFVFTADSVVVHYRDQA